MQVKSLGYKTDLIFPAFDGEIIDEAVNDETLVNEKIRQRLASGDLHISGWLAGSQNSQAKDDALVIENRVIKKYSHWIEGLSRTKISSARRPMRAIPQDFSITAAEGNERVIEFSLPPGSLVVYSQGCSPIV